MNRYSITDIAEVIDTAMREYIQANPDDIHHGYENACEAGLRAAMKLGRGIFNPATIKLMCYMNDSVFDDTKYILLS